MAGWEEEGRKKGEGRRGRGRDFVPVGPVVTSQIPLKYALWYTAGRNASSDMDGRLPVCCRVRRHDDRCDQGLLRRLIFRMIV